jgi:hypothetical protein
MQYHSVGLSYSNRILLNLLEIVVNFNNNVMCTMFMYYPYWILRLWALILGMPLSTRTLCNTPTKLYFYNFIFFVIPTRYLSQGKMKKNDGVF